MACISQDTLGAAVGISGSEVGRVERGEAPWLTVVQASRLLRAAGLDLWAKTFPTGPALRDAGICACWLISSGAYHPNCVADGSGPFPTTVIEGRST